MHHQYTWNEALVCPATIYSNAQGEGGFKEKLLHFSVVSDPLNEVVVEESLDLTEGMRPNIRTQIQDQSHHHALPKPDHECVNGTVREAFGSLRPEAWTSVEKTLRFDVGVFPDRLYIYIRVKFSLVTSEEGVNAFLGGIKVSSTEAAQGTRVLARRRSVAAGGVVFGGT